MWDLNRTASNSGSSDYWAKALRVAVPVGLVVMLYGTSSVIYEQFKDKQLAIALIIVICAMIPALLISGYKYGEAVTRNSYERSMDMAARMTAVPTGRAMHVAPWGQAPKMIENQRTPIPASSDVYINGDKQIKLRSYDYARLVASLVSYGYPAFNRKLLRKAGLEFANEAYSVITAWMLMKGWIGNDEFALRSGGIAKGYSFQIPQGELRALMAQTDWSKIVDDLEDAGQTVFDSPEE